MSLPNGFGVGSKFSRKVYLTRQAIIPDRGGSQSLVTPAIVFEAIGGSLDDPLNRVILRVELVVLGQFPHLDRVVIGVEREEIASV